MFSFLVLTQSSNAIIGPIAKIIGMIMDGIYNFFYNSFGVVSIGASIIFLTIIVRLIILPLAIHQQKSSIAMQKVQPQIKALQDKYKNKKDKDSQQKMQMEMSQIYKENNANPASGCLPLLVQMPIFFSLFAVLRNIPAYIVKIKDEYVGIVNNVTGVSGYVDKLNELNQQLGPNEKSALIKDFDPTVSDNVVDLLAKFTSKQWTVFHETFPNIFDHIEIHVDKINEMYNFMGINLADSPVDISAGVAGFMTIGVMIPILCFGFQLISMKLTMKQSASSGQSNQQMQTQKTMMYMMPLMSLFFVVSMPAGLGLYWMIGSIVQILQQLGINKFMHGDKEKK